MTVSCPVDGGKIRMGVRGLGSGALSPLSNSPHQGERIKAERNEPVGFVKFLSLTVFSQAIKVLWLAWAFFFAIPGRFFRPKDFFLAPAFWRVASWGKPSGSILLIRNGAQPQPASSVSIAAKNPIHN